MLRILRHNWNKKPEELIWPKFEIWKYPINKAKKRKPEYKAQEEEPLSLVWRSPIEGD